MNGSEVSLVRAIRGPVTLITIGVLFALNNFTRYGFDQTWPVILIVFGLLSLLGRSTARPMQPAGPSPQYGYPVPPQGGYRQSPYTGTEPGPVKGGFGSSAPPRPGDPGSMTPPSGENV
jgi:hypothetical protein